MSLLAYVVDVVLGPVGILLNLGDLGVLFGDGQRVLSLLLSGELNQSLDAVLSGEFAESGHLLANGVGTLLWLAVAGAALGEVGEVGELADVFEIFG